MKVTSIESDHKVQLPPEWVEELGFNGLVALEKGAGEITLRPCSAASWDDVFSEKLAMGTQTTVSDLPEVSGDDYFL